MGTHCPTNTQELTMALTNQQTVTGEIREEKHTHNAIAQRLRRQRP